MAVQIRNRCLAYGEPLWYLLVAFYGSILALIDMLIFLNRPSDLFHISKLKDRLFGQFWLRMGPIFAARDEETVVPKLVSQASGIVLELGPGMGSQLPRYDVSKLTKVYGVEPNAELHDALRARIKACRLDDIYEIVPCGVEDVATLEKYSISLGSIDTVLSVQVQCSVPDPDEILRQLYTLLKPGGQMVIYEHVESKDPVSRMVQNVYNTVWPFFLGNCHLTRNTHKSVIQAGDWDKVELTLPTSEDAWLVFPRISGRVVKKL